MTILEERLIEDISHLLHGRPIEREYCIKAIKDRFAQLGEDNYTDLNKNLQHDLNSILDKFPARRKRCIKKIVDTFCGLKFLKN